MLFFLGSLSKSKWLTPFQGGSGVVRCSIHWPSSILTDVHREIRSVVHYLFQSNYCRCSLTLNHAGSFEQLGHVQALGISIPRYPKSLCVCLFLLWGGCQNLFFDDCFAKRCQESFAGASSGNDIQTVEQLRALLSCHSERTCVQLFG